MAFVWFSGFDLKVWAENLDQMVGLLEDIQINAACIRPGRNE